MIPGRTISLREDFVEILIHCSGSFIPILTCSATFLHYRLKIKFTISEAASPTDFIVNAEKA